MIVYYSLPAEKLEEGMSTADAQDIVGVSVSSDGWVLYDVAAPPSEDPLDEQEPEGRIAKIGELVDLATYANTDVDGSVMDEAVNVWRQD